jgi:glyoxylase-like metal-dependent hydrolase (beta-lactamase superfamily II)
MNIPVLRSLACGAMLLATSPHVPAQAPAPPAAPVVKEGSLRRISDHVYLIPDGKASMVPNVGIVVGENATLVVDPGMGMQSGTVVLREAMRVRKGADIYVVNTHFHPEHTTGELAFPDSAVILRAAPQQQDVDEMGMKWVKSFASRSPVIADVLRDFTQFRPPTEVFAREKTLDLGGVRVRILHLGPGHTRGDTVVFVEEDRVLFSGDLVMNRLFPAFSTPQSSGRAWLASLDVMEKLRPLKVVGAHYPAGSASLIADYREYLQALRARVLELKKQGRSSGDAATQAQKEFAAKYKDWAQPARIRPAAAVFYREG